MSLDPQIQAFLQNCFKKDEPVWGDLSVDEVRKEFAETRKLLKEIITPVAEVEDKFIPSPAGKIPIRVYTPNKLSNFPILVYFHGGGWVLGDLDSVDGICRYFAKRANCLVVSVDYRLAPEHSFPASVEDAYEATKWIVANAKTLKGDSERVIVGGDSAGGNLATVISMMARDQGGPSLIYQLLLYPVTQHSFETQSYRNYKKGYFLTKEEMAWYWRHYLKNDSEGKHPYASPLLADDLSGLPPAFVVTPEYDPLRDEGEAYANRLHDAGVVVKKRRYMGMIHSFLNMSGSIKQAETALEEIAAELRIVFNENKSKG